MQDLEDKGIIWNRACMGDFQPTFAGDRALGELLRAHGLIMNGGVLHAVESLAADEVVDAQHGYQFYGLETVASLLSRAKVILDSEEDPEPYESELDYQYGEMVPDDECLLDVFNAHLQLNPSDYAPV